MNRKAAIIVFVVIAAALYCGNLMAMIGFGISNSYVMDNTDTGSGGSGGIEGVVTWAATGEPVSENCIVTCHHNAVCDDSGQYTITGIPAGTHDFTVMTVGVGYFAFYGDSVEIEEGSMLVKNVSLVLRDDHDTGTEELPPVIESVESKYGKYFLEGISVNNDYKVNVEWNGTPHTVEFIVNEGEPEEEVGQSWGASHTYDMGSDFDAGYSPNTNTLEIIAENAEGYRSESKILHPYVFPIPDWLPLASGFSVNPKARLIKFEGSISFPEPPFEAEVDGNDVPSWIPFFGGEDLGVEPTSATIEIELVSDGTGCVGLSGQSGFAAIGKSVGGKIWGKGYIRFSHSKGVSLTGSDLGFSLYGSIGDELGVLEVIPATAAYSKVPGLRTINDRAQIKASISPGISVSVNFISGDEELVFKHSEIEGSIGVRIGLEVDLWAVTAEVYTNGKPSITVQVPAEPSYLKDVSMWLRFGIIIETWVHDWDIYSDFSWSYSPEAGGMMIQRLAGPVVEGPRLISRDYIYWDNYSRDATTPDGIRLMRFGVLGAGPGSGQSTMLIENVFPHAKPDLCDCGDTLVLVYVYDDPNDTQIQATEIGFRIFDGATWSPPELIFDDTRSEFNPQAVADKNGNAFAAWERVKDENLLSDDIETMAAEMEVVYSIYDNGSNTWSKPAAISDNEWLDYKPLLSRNSAGDVMLVWISNKGNILQGDNTDPDTLMYAVWDGAGLSESDTVVTDLAYMRSFAFDYGTDTAVLVYVQDMDDSPATADDQELYYTTYNAGIWSVPLRLTDNGVQDAAPTVFYGSDGKFKLFWHQGDDLAMLDDIFAGAPMLVKTGFSSLGALGYKICMNPDGDIVLVWEDLSDTGADMFYCVYDNARDNWSEELRLTDNAAPEKSFDPFFNSAGNLITAYCDVDTVTKQNDLYFLEYTICSDVAIGPEDIDLSDTNPSPGDTVTIMCTVHNSGDVATEDIEVAFYDGNPDQTGTQIDQNQTIWGIMDAGGVGMAQVEWTVPHGPTNHEIFVRADPRNVIFP